GDPFVARVGEGGFEWARSFSSEGTAVARGVAPLAGGGIALAIEFDGRLAADSAAGLWRDGDRLLLAGSFADALGTLRSEGGRDAWAMALGARGAPVWQERLGGAGDEVVAAGAAGGGRLLFGGSLAEHYQLVGAAGEASGESDGF